MEKEKWRSSNSEKLYVGRIFNDMESGMSTDEILEKYKSKIDTGLILDAIGTINTAKARLSAAL